MPIHSAFLKYFIEVYHCGSIREAARNLNVSSSAVNRQILKIENELGAELFTRVSGGIHPTRAGELLSLHIQRTLSDEALTLAQISDLSVKQRSLVSIAGQESVITRFLPPALLKLHADHPEITTAFKSASGAQLLELLRLKSVDIALAFDPEPGADIKINIQITLPVGAVLTPAHPLAQQKAVTLADCMPYPIVLPDQSWPLRARLDTEIANADLQLNIVTSSNSVEFLKMMVDQQLGLGFQTVVGIESQVEQGELRLVPLQTPDPMTQEFALCTLTDTEPRPEIENILSILISRLKEYST